MPVGARVEPSIRANAGTLGRGDTMWCSDCRGRAWCVTALLVVTVLWAPGVVAQELTDPHLGYTASLPDGYAEIPVPQSATASRAALRGDLGSRSYGLLLLTPLDGPIRRKPMNLADAEAIATANLQQQPEAEGRADYRTTRWGDHYVKFVLVQHGHWRTGLTTLVARIPLRQRALQVVVTGPSSEAGILNGDFLAFIRSLEGETNWLTGPQRIEKLGADLIRIGVGALAFVLLGGLLIAVAVVHISRKQGVSFQYSPRQTTLPASGVDFLG